jgi:hypothetical protein
MLQLRCREHVKMAGERSSAYLRSQRLEDWDHAPHVVNIESRIHELALFAMLGAWQELHSVLTSEVKTKHTGHCKKAAAKQKA